jgi:hypothetical protein
MEVNGNYMLLHDGGNKDIEKDDVITAFSPTISSTREYFHFKNQMVNPRW